MTPHARRTKGPERAQPGGSYVDDDLSADLASASLSLARKFHAGATLWVISPQWEPHAHHVAVEFVHPVIMGKRALPSVALVEPDPVAQARVATRPGDVIIAVASADEPAGARPDAPGARVGRRHDLDRLRPRPPAGAATTCCGWRPTTRWCRRPARFVLMYHLLWELTHVCFEHPGLLTPDGASAPTTGASRAATRAGSARWCWPGRRRWTALVRTGSGEESVDVTVLGEVEPAT